MDNRSHWRMDLLEDGMIVFVLLSAGLIIAGVKLLPPLLRWAKIS